MIFISLQQSGKRSGSISYALMIKTARLMCRFFMNAPIPASIPSSYSKKNGRHLLLAHAAPGLTRKYSLEDFA